MSRIRLATILGSVALTIYIFLVGLTAMLLGPSAFLKALMIPLPLLDGLFSAVFDRSAFGRNLLSVSSLWLTFVCLIDLSMIFASIEVRQSLTSAYANSYTKRLVTGLRFARQ
jgi:hypothetical protein